MSGSWVITWIDENKNLSCKEISNPVEIANLRLSVMKNYGIVLSIVYIEKFSSGEIRHIQNHTDRF
jgi:hypothetical protein